MSGTDLPVWLADALSGTKRGIPRARGGSVDAGDLCLLATPADHNQAADGRLVLVLDVDLDLGLASVMLAHTDFEIRTGLDVLLTGTEMGLPFDIAVQTDLVGPVAASSLAGTAVGHVPEPLLNPLRDAAVMGDIAASLLGRVGMPIRGKGDSRWGWKVAESAVLDRLIAAHSPAVFESVDPVQALAKALRATGKCSGGPRDDLGTVTECLLAYMSRREMPPGPVLTLLAQPPTAAALGNDMIRAIGPLLRVA